MTSVSGAGGSGVDPRIGDSDDNDVFKASSTVDAVGHTTSIASFDQVCEDRDGLRTSSTEIGRPMTEILETSAKLRSERQDQAIEHVSLEYKEEQDTSRALFPRYTHDF
ncbi:MAG: hypothetical protein Q9176_005648 [Flavoplaca citrina]